MQRHERDSSRSPEQRQPVIKSQKSINISLGFHIKTENDRGDDEPQRSPDAARVDMRDTWRRPKMPYNKLPDVFNQQKNKKKYGGKVRQDMLTNIDKLVQNSEYKEAQKYLEPLKFKQEDKKKQIVENRNPLNPVKKMLKMANKANQQIKQLQDLSVDKIRNRTGPKISQFISLEVIKRSHNTGTVKKMLHVPSLTLVCIREQPYSLKESRNAIRDWTHMWREKLSGENMPFVVIHDVLYNFPEGALSVFTEYFKSRSLLNLLDLTSTLPESVIREIFIQVIKALEVFYFNTSIHFGGLSPSQIMFTEDNKIKLSLGLFYHIPNLNSENIYYIKAAQKTNIFDLNNTFSRFLKNNDKGQNIEAEKTIDIFKLGLCMLHCAIGSFENLQQSPMIFEAVKYIFTEQGQRLAEIDNLCCLVHSQGYLLQLNQSAAQSQTQRKPQQRFINYIKLLKDRFSIHFINFICQCLKLHHSKRATLADLQAHTFLTAPHDNDNTTVKVDLGNMLAISRSWNQEGFEAGSSEKMENFMRHIKTVLEFCNRETLSELHTAHQDRIHELGKEVGLNQQVLGPRLEKIIADMIKNAK